MKPRSLGQSRRKLLQISTGVFVKTIRTTALAASALAAALIATPASAATFVLNGLGDITNASARAGFVAAARYWSSVLTDDATIYVNVGFSSLDPGVLGQTGSSGYYDDASIIAGQMVFDQTSLLDVSAVASIADVTATGLTSFEKAGYVNDGAMTGIDTTKQVYDADGSANNQFLLANSATLKALGYTGFGNLADASVTFNSDFNFDFDARDGVTAGYYDFIGVATHEIGHALGFVSRVDFADYYGCPNGPGCAATSNFNFNNYPSAGIGVLDLFRYSETGLRNVTPGQETYFSVDGGVSEVYGNANFSTGSFNGDGSQASHWKAPGNCNQNAFIGIMNPYLCSGMGAVVKAQDLAALDAIGWDLAEGARDNSAYGFTSGQIRAFVPEPAVWMQLILGFGVIGGSYRSARRRKATLAAA